MAALPGSFAIVVHPDGFDLPRLAEILILAQVTPLNIISFNQWGEGHPNKSLPLMLISEDGTYEISKPEK